MLGGEPTRRRHVSGIEDRVDVGVSRPEGVESHSGVDALLHEGADGGREEPERRCDRRRAREADADDHALAGDRTGASGDGHRIADPVKAIDGGPDGLEPARACVRVAADHLIPGGFTVLQVGTREQVDRIGAELDERLRVGEVREFERGVLARLDRT